jgi:two-component sensor histidine kinase
LLTAVEVYIAQEIWDKPITWGLAFRRSFKEVLVYSICTAGILWFCGRLRPQAGHRVRWFMVHMVGALAFSLSHVAFVSWLEAGERSVQTGEILTFNYLFEKLLVSYTLSDIFKYWIVVLGYLGWHYYQAFRERERQAAALSIELAQARLQALRMQINPHFLFNTLNAISALIHENPDAADRMIVLLSQLLRRTLERSDMQEVPLREELEFLRGYLQIEQMRFPDRLTVMFDVDPNAQDLLVPHLILQPLVENALRHGILPREEAGRIEISARLAGANRLELTVRDNGIGLPATRGTAKGGGIGLPNIRSRLAQLYGDAQHFEIANAAAGGATAFIRIPCRPADHSPPLRGGAPPIHEAGQATLSHPAPAATPAPSA